jgi:hypothetical protein
MSIRSGLTGIVYLPFGAGNITARAGMYRTNLVRWYDTWGFGIECLEGRKPMVTVSINRFTASVRGKKGKV